MKRHTWVAAIVIVILLAGCMGEDRYVEATKAHVTAVNFTSDNATQAVADPRVRDEALRVLYAVEEVARQAFPSGPVAALGQSDYLHLRFNSSAIIDLPNLDQDIAFHDAYIVLESAQFEDGAVLVDSPTRGELRTQRSLTDLEVLLDPFRAS